MDDARVISLFLICFGVFVCLGVAFFRLDQGILVALFHGVALVSLHFILFKVFGGIEESIHVVSRCSGVNQSLLFW